MTGRSLVPASAVLLLLIVTCASVPGASADDEGIVERIAATVSGFFDHASSRSDQESYSAAHQTAEETIEAQQRKLQYGGDTWWGDLIRYVTRGYQVIRAYLHPYREFAEAYILKYLPASVSEQLRPTKTTAEKLVDSVSDYVQSAGASAGGAASGAQKFVADTQDKASEGYLSVAAAVAEKVMAAGKAARDAGDGAGSALNEDLKELSKKAEEAREGLKAATDAASRGAAQAADAAGDHITDTGDAAKAAAGSQQADTAREVRSEL